MLPTAPFCVPSSIAENNMSELPVHWIIENIVKEPSYLELSEAVARAGHPLLNLRGDFANEMLAPYRNQCVVFNGSIQMCKLVYPILREQGCAPVLYSSWQNFRCSAWYPYVGDLLFNDDYVMVPFSEVNRRLHWFYGVFAKEAMIFIRPDSGDKTFKGGPVDRQDFARFYDQFESEREAMVIVSSPKNIRGEWRFVVTGEKEIVAQSSYRSQGVSTLVPSAPDGANKLCREILVRLEGRYPDNVFCIDIAEDGDGKFWLLELTSFSAAGLSACDKDAIVRAVSEHARRAFTK
jgi:hypothetical protein